MKFSDYIAYFETAAINHKVIAHDPNNDHHTFYRLEDILNGMSLKNKHLCLVVETTATKPNDEKSDNIRKLKTGAFAILQYVTKDDVAALDAAFDLTEEVAEDIVSKILNDTRKSKSVTKPPIPIQVDVNTINITPMGPMLDNHYGWKVEFTINSRFSNGLQLDESKWNNETKFL
jgi:hypothetical protein